MVARRKSSKGGIAARVAGVVAASCLIVACAGYGIASAGATDADPTFGVGETTISIAAEEEAATAGAAASDSLEVTDASVLETAATRDISANVDVMENRLEEERRAAEEAARIEEQEHIAAAQQARDKQASTKGLPALSEVDWTVGKDAFIAEWTQRIDAYLAGSPLSGYGSVFASAAWEYGVDPRFSPAISNTESSKGANCFRSHNAWGWMGTTTWTSWEESIYAHVAGLANGYGYTISEWAAAKYCPPTWQDWYNKTYYQMTLI